MALFFAFGRGQGHSPKHNMDDENIVAPEGDVVAEDGVTEAPAEEAAPEETVEEEAA